MRLKKEKEFVIREVWLAKKNNIMHVTIPKESNIKVGDYVTVQKVEHE